MQNTEKKFEERYRKWKNYIHDSHRSLSSFTTDYINNEHFDSIVKLGRPAIPFIKQKIKTDEDGHFLVHALDKINSA